MDHLVIAYANGTTRSISLHGDRLAIGRHPSNAIVLPDPYVSGVHAQLQRMESGWWIEDLGSTNGTWLNGRRVQSGVVFPEDELRIGGCVLRLARVGKGTVKPAPAPAPRPSCEPEGPPESFDLTDLMPPPSR